MIYVYRRHRSTGARELAEALGGRRVREVPNLVPGDTLICWGETVNPRTPPGVRVVNGAAITSKFMDARRLLQAGVPTVEVAQTRPTAPPPTPLPAPGPDPARGIWTEAQDAAEAFADTEFARTPVSVRAAADLVGLFTRLQTALGAPPPVQRPPRPAPLPQGEWLARSNAHIGGTDLLRPPARGDYYSKKENLVEEYRLHMFNGRSIRAGRKVPRDGMQPHPWIRSYDGGWRINYDGFQSTQAQRGLAARACDALGLTFGAVDMGVKADGTLLVLEVNRAPGLEGGTVTSYATAINRLVNGNEEPRRRRV